MDHTLVTKKKKNHHPQVWDNLACCFGSRGGFPYPLWGLFFRFNVISKKPGFVTRHNVFFFKKFSSSFARRRSSWQITTRCSFCSSVSSRGTNFAATRCIFNFSVKMVWHDHTDITHSSATSQIVNRRFERMTARTRPMKLSSVEGESRSERGSSSIYVRPYLNFRYHSYGLVWLLVSSPDSCCKISKISELFFAI